MTIPEQDRQGYNALIRNESQTRTPLLYKLCKVLCKITLNTCTLLLKFYRFLGLLLGFLSTVYIIGLRVCVLYVCMGHVA